MTDRSPTPPRRRETSARTLPLCVLGILLGLGAFPARLPAATPVLSEFMADNRSTLADEDGEFSDWIEVANPGPEPLPLAGFFLTDDPERPTRWAFPALTLAPGEHRVVFASGKKPAPPLRPAPHQLPTRCRRRIPRPRRAGRPDGGRRLRARISPAVRGRRLRPSPGPGHTRPARRRQPRLPGSRRRLRPGTRVDRGGVSPGPRRRLGDGPGLRPGFRHRIRLRRRNQPQPRPGRHRHPVLHRSRLQPRARARRQPRDLHPHHQLR
jgi:hypothetical protein